MPMQLLGGEYADSGIKRTVIGDTLIPDTPGGGHTFVDPGIRSRDRDAAHQPRASPTSSCLPFGGLLLHPTEPGTSPARRRLKASLLDGGDERGVVLVVLVRVRGGERGDRGHQDIRPANVRGDRYRVTGARVAASKRPPTQERVTGSLVGRQVLEVH